MLSLFLPSHDKRYAEYKLDGVTIEAAAAKERIDSLMQKLKSR